MARLDNLTTLRQLIPALIETGADAYASDMLDLEMRRADPRDCLLGRNVLDKYLSHEAVIAKLADLLGTDVTPVRIFADHIVCSRRFYGQVEGERFYTLVIQRIFPGCSETKRLEILEAVMATQPRR